MEERTSSLLNVLAPCLAQVEFLSILSRYVFSTRDCATGDPKAIVWTGNEKSVYPNLHVDRNWWIFSSVFQTFGTS